MTDEFGDFRSPTLHLVVAEDEPYWQDALQKFFSDRIEEWSLYRTHQFHFECHRCGSYEEFTELSERLLRAGDLVYATVDLLMPLRKTDQVPDDTVWRDLIVWCLEHDMAGTGERFEFCVISGAGQLLDEIFENPRYAPMLQRKRVKRAFKEQIANAQDVALRRIWEHLRSFVLSNLRFCTVPDLYGGSTSDLLWFGRHEALLRLLEQTDDIARRPKKGDFYIAFADACGYEEDWFRLCCHLKGIDPTIRNLTETSSRDDRWRRELQSPPGALLVSHINGSHDRGHNLHTRMPQFLSAAEAAESFVCFQFPELDSDLDANQLLREKEREVLKACFAQIYRHPEPFGQGGASLYRGSDHIIRFPSYETLKAAGVVRATIAFKVKQCQDEFELHGVSIDPEITEVLAEMPWNGPRMGGLDGLNLAIKVAFENASEQHLQPGSFVDLVSFPEETVQEYFGSPEGFAIRGRRLVRLLDEHWPEGWSTRTPEVIGKHFDLAVSGLEQIYEIFHGLQRLMELATALETDHKHIEFSEEFPLADFEALKDAHEFLLRLFISPDALQRRIDEFRRYEHDPNWQDNYPSLEAREDWRELIEHVRFTWPYRKFRLPTPIDDYLRSSGVIAEIYREMEGILPRHPDLEKEWHKLEGERRALEAALQEREVQRRAARRYAREAQSQPVLLLLGLRAEEHKSRFTGTLQSFLFFNAAIAACENLYRFNGDCCKTGDVKQLLERTELGGAIQLLRDYRHHLNGRRRLPESVFRRWVDEWPQAGNQENAARVIARIANRTLSDQDFSKRLKDAERALLRKLTALETTPVRCPVEDMLALFGMLRNMFDKMYMKRFWDEQIEDVYDALRGFVLATTDSEFRFGQISEDGDHAQFWSRNKLETSNGLPPIAQEFRGRLCAFDRSSPDGEYTCFPIDDLIRINPDDGSPFAFWSGEKWLDLTSIDGNYRPETDYSWLPQKEQRENSHLWRWTYEWSSKLATKSAS